MTRRSITFRQYLIRRDYSLRSGSGPLLRRMFLTAWAEPGFHRFWRVWNPLYGYFLFRFYRFLGGERRRVPATLGVFVVSGFMLHDLPLSLVTGRWQVTTAVTFVVFGVAALLSRSADRHLGLSHWPRPVHVALNLGLVVAGLVFGAWVQSRFVGSGFGWIPLTISDAA